jgi:hypothetical protein
VNSENDYAILTSNDIFHDLSASATILCSGDGYNYKIGSGNYTSGDGNSGESFK